MDILILIFSLFICPTCKPAGTLELSIVIVDSDGDTRKTGTAGEELIKQVTVCNNPTGVPGSVDGVVVEIIQPLGIADITIPTLAPNDCTTIDIPISLNNDDYFLSQECEVMVTGLSNGVNVSDSLTIEIEEEIPIACVSFDGNTFHQQYIKSPSNTDVTSGDAYIIEVNCNGSIETITGNLGQQNYTSDNPNSQFIQNASGDFCNDCSFQTDWSQFTGCTMRMRIGGLVCESQSEWKEIEI